MGSAGPAFTCSPLVANGYTGLILEFYGQDAAMHARSAAPTRVPLNAPSNCEAEVEIDGG